jgi:NAD-dependent DNA ligase
MIYKPLSQINNECVYKIKLVFLRWNTTTVYTESSAVNHVRFLNLFHRMGRLVPAHNENDNNLQHVNSLYKDMLDNEQYVTFTFKSS